MKRIEIIITHTDALWVQAADGWIQYLMARSGASPSQFEMTFEGYTSLTADTLGHLHIGTELGPIILKRPLAYSYNPATGALTELGWQPTYQINTSLGIVTFGNLGSWSDMLVLEVAEKTIEVSSTVMLENNLCWSTYYYSVGGFTVAYSVENDAMNRTYVGGYTSTPVFLTTPGSFQTEYGGDYSDGFIVRFGLNHELDFATFVGGDATDEVLSIRSFNDRIYAGGYSFSTDFPMITNGGFNQNIVGNNKRSIIFAIDIVTGFLNWSTHFSNGDGCYSVTTDGEFLFVGGISNGQLITLNSAGTPYLQSTYVGGYSDAYIAKFSSSNQLQWSTYFGGSNTDYLTSILAVDNQLYVFGWTKSGNFPTEDSGSGAYYQSSISGEFDLFISKFNAQHELTWSTYFGGSDFDMAAKGKGLSYFNGTVYVVGTTASHNFPTLQFGDGYFQEEHTGEGFDGFLISFDHNNVLEWSTYFGGQSINYQNDINDQVHGVQCDYMGNFFITGQTRWVNFPTIDPGGAYIQGEEIGGSIDAFLSFFNAEKDLIWSTPIGGSFVDVCYDINLVSDRLFVTGYSDSRIGSNINPYPTFNPGNGAFYVDNLSENTFNQMVVSSFCLADLITNIHTFSEPEISEIQIFPNPTSGSIRINGLLSNSIFQIFSTNGEVLYEKLITEVDAQFNLSEFPQGLYLIRVVTGAQVLHGRFVKF